MMERTLFEYGVLVWLEQNVWSKAWKEDFRRAVCLCIDPRFYLDLARKQPLAWWERNRVKEGIAKAFCKYSRNFKVAKENGWLLPHSKPIDPIEQQFQEYCAEVR